MKKILIIKTGTTFDSIRSVYGDFEDFIIRACGIDKKDALIFPAYKERLIPVKKIATSVSSAIITGSHSMVTEMEDWTADLCGWIREFAAEGLPVLGICYGHQLLAKAWGGVVDYHPCGRESGTVSISLTQRGLKDRLLDVCPEHFIAHVSHAQSVIKLPEKADVLAYNDFEPHHAFNVDGNVWGVQFHPEFNAGIMESYIRERQEFMESEGYNIHDMLSSVSEHDFGVKLLRRFIELSGEFH